MTKSTFLIIVLILIICIIFITSMCILLICKTKKLISSTELLQNKNADYEKSAKLHSDFRIIRHDFANYIQAAGALFDEQSLAIIKTQKGKVRELITKWNHEAEAFIKEQD